MVDHEPPPPRPAEPPPAPKVHPFHSVAGWVKLGEREVNGKVDHDRIEVGSKEGGFEKMGFYVEDSDLELIDLNVKFGVGEPWHPALKHYFREGERSKVIEFPGNTMRNVLYIDFTYKNLPGGGHARMEVWGWKRAK